MAQRGDRAVSGAQRRHVTARAPRARERGLSPTGLPRQLLRGRRREQTHEGVHQIVAFLRELRIGGRVGPRGQWPAADGLLIRQGGGRNAHLGRERALVELAQGRHERLAAESTEAAVEEAVGTARDAVVVAVVRVGVGKDHRIGNGVEQPESEDVRRRPGGDGGGPGRDRLAIDAEGRVQRRRDPLLEDRPSLGGELVAGPAGGAGMEGRRVPFDFVPGAARHRRLVALPAAFRIEERPEPGGGSELAVEDDAAARETVTLGGRESPQGIARLRPAASGHDGEREPEPPDGRVAAHGERTGPVPKWPTRSMV